MSDWGAQVDNNLRQRMLEATNRFPVGEPPQQMHQRAVQRRRTAITGLTLAGCAVLSAGVVLAVPLMSDSAHDRVAVTPAMTADYIGSAWRLIRVRDAATSTEIPANLGARMSLLPNGIILAHDGVNQLGGQFIRTSGGFTVISWGGTDVGYVGDDPRSLAAIRAFAALAQGSHDVSATAGSAAASLVTVDQQRLILEVGSLQLTFQRTGPATTPTPVSSATTS
ncbi:MAG: hypothetical protein U0Q19_22925 [Kineosporiaceae bacterium]